MAYTGDVVISGIGCRLPESSTFEEFKSKLLTGENLVKVNKWVQYTEKNMSVKCGAIRNMNLFDNVFFGIGTAQSKPQALVAKQALEVTFEAIVDAGLSEAELSGSNVQVTSNCAYNDRDIYFINDSLEYSVLGQSRTMIPNRISFWLNLLGPSAAQNSCNSLEGFAQAVRDIRAGACNMAIITSTDLLEHPNTQLQFYDRGVLSPDSKTRAYDENGNGYGRSDAVIVFILQRACDAKRSYAAVENIFNTFYAERAPIGTPLVDSWTKLYNEFYGKSKINPNDVAYVEGHGEGIKENDLVELEGIQRFFSKGRDTPLLLGSIKSNIGHTGGSCGLVSILKAVIAFQTGTIVGNLDCERPLTGATTETGAVQIVRENTKLPENSLIGINSRGDGGTYAHLVLRSTNRSKKEEEEKSEMPWLILLSSRLESQMEGVFTLVEETAWDTYFYRLTNVTFNRRRENYLSRGFIIKSEEATISKEFGAWDSQPRPVWFIFTGMGCQWVGMGEGLLKIPLTRASLLRSHEILAKKGLDLLSIITTKEPNPFDNILNSFVGIGAIQIALVDLLRAVNIIPDGIIGHSVGEVACAYADGCLTQEQTLLAAYSRGRASIETELIKGMMAAVGKGYNDMKDMLPEDIEVACHNSNTSSTISGPADSVNAFVEELKAKKIFAKAVNVANIAYHSRYIKPAGEKLIKYLKEVITEPKERSSKWISTSVPEANWDSELAKYCSAEYQTNNLLSSVLFEEGCKHIPENAICIEVAPHGLLQSILKKALDKKTLNLALTNWSSKDPVVFLLQALGKLHMAGLEPQVNNLYPPVEYPVPINTPSCSKLVTFDHQDTYGIKVEPEVKLYKKIEIEPRDYLRSWNVDGNVIYPFVLLLDSVWKLFVDAKRKAREELDICFEDIRVLRTLEVIDHKYEVTLILQPATGVFEVYDEHNQVILSGKVNILEAKPTEQRSIESTENVWNGSDISTELKQRGYEFAVGSLRDVSVNNDVWSGVTTWNNNWVQLFEAMLQLHLLSSNSEPDTLLLHRSMHSVLIQTAKHITDTTADNNVKITVDTTQNIIHTGSIEIRLLDYKELPRQVRLELEYPKFIPYSFTDCQNSQNFIEFAFNIVLDNIPQEKNGTNLSIAMIADGESPLELKTQVENLVLRHTRKIKLSTSIMTVDETKEEENANIIISGPNTIKQALRVSGKDTFVLTLLGKKEVDGLKKYGVITSFDVGNGMVGCLLKQLLKERSSSYVTFEPEKDNIVELLNSVKFTSHIVYAVSTVEPVEGIVKFTEKFASIVPPSLRWVFVLDESAPKFSPSSLFYDNELSKGLRLNIYKDGAWSWLQNIVIPFSKLPTPPVEVKNNEELEVQYTSSPHEGTQWVDFSGTKGEEAVIGIGTIDQETKKLIPDPQLTWNIAKSVNLEDATSVPTTYTLAYYAIVILGKLKEQEKILVSGSATPAALATITVALQIVKPTNVFVTVEDENERREIMDKFPTLIKSNIHLHTSPECWNEIKQKGSAHVVCNHLEGQRLAQAFDCVAPFGRFFTFNTADIRNNTKLGMLIFITYVSFFTISPKSIQFITEEEKDEIKTLIDEGIKKNVLLPFNVGSIAETKPQAVAQRPQVKTIQINGASSYIIVAENVDISLYLAENLVLKGARNIVIQQTNELSGRHRYQQQVLTKNKKAKIVFTKETQSAGLLAEAKKLGEVGAVIAVSSKCETSNLVKQLSEQWTDTNGQLVVMTLPNSELAAICKTRNSNGYPSTVIAWNGDQADAYYVLSVLDKIFPLNDNINVNSGKLFRNKRVIKPETVLKDILPKSKKELENLGAVLKTETEIKEMKTQSQNLDRCVNTAPVIVIPGLEQDPTYYLKTFARECIYPMLYVDWGHDVPSIEQLAAMLLKYNIKDFNLIGVEWGNNVALQLAKNLEEKGLRVRLFLIGYSPVALNTVLDLNMEESLLSRYFDDVVEQIKQDQDSTGSLLEAALRTAGCDENESIQKGLGYIQKVLKAANKLALSEPLINSPTILFPKDVFTNKLVSAKCEEEYPNLDWLNWFESKELITIIHDNVCGPMYKDVPITEGRVDLRTFLKYTEPCHVKGVFDDLLF